ncbi:hypothetical protein BD779DRAFT_1472782 [Infundibulicybe gibba]|nr:hypothetical protein BD779DRAFT_1472782 [Infundibulicybe gibba]
MPLMNLGLRLFGTFSPSLPVRVLGPMFYRQQYSSLPDSTTTAYTCHSDNSNTPITLNSEQQIIEAMQKLVEAIENKDRITETKFGVVRKATEKNTQLLETLFEFDDAEADDR